MTGTWRSPGVRPETEADVLFVRDGKFPTGRLVRGVWVSTPYDIEGEHLFNSDNDQGN